MPSSMPREQWLVSYGPSAFGLSWLAQRELEKAGLSASRAHPIECLLLTGRTGVERRQCLCGGCLSPTP